MSSTATSVQAPLVRGRVARATLVDDCGMPQISNSVYTTEGVITVNSTKNIDTGDEIKGRQMNGIIGVFEPGRATALNFTIAINLIRIDPGLWSMLTGDPVILDASGDLIVGFEELMLERMLQNFGLEVWTDTSGNFCTSGAPLVGYMLYPMVGQSYGTIDNISDGLITATINGMSYGNPSWGKGPYGTGSAAGRTVTDGVTTAGSPNVTSATAAFTGADVGATISTVGGLNIPAGARILSVTDATHAVLTVNATGTGVAEHFVIGAGDGSSILGPVNQSAVGAPSAGRLLQPVAKNAHRHFELTNIAPPAAQTVAGPQDMTLPSPY